MKSVSLTEDQCISLRPPPLEDASFELKKPQETENRERTVFELQKDAIYLIEVNECLVQGLIRQVLPRFKAQKAQAY
jgi:hypothetical protein